jgi:hypothetical protein
MLKKGDNHMVMKKGDYRGMMKMKGDYCDMVKKCNAHDLLKRGD